MGRIRWSEGRSRQGCRVRPGPPDEAGVEQTAQRPFSAQCRGSWGASETPPTPFTRCGCEKSAGFIVNGTGHKSERPTPRTPRDRPLSRKPPFKRINVPLKKVHEKHEPFTGAVNRSLTEAYSCLASPSPNAHTARRNASIATATSSCVTDSAGWWLTPPLQRTNSIPTGQRSAIAIAS